MFRLTSSSTARPEMLMTAMQLRGSLDAMDQQIAARMVALRPHLSYEHAAAKEEGQ